MPTTRTDLDEAIEGLGLTGRPVCLHVSFRSFDGLEGGPDSLLDAFLDRGGTVMALTLSYAFASAPPATGIYARNGGDETAFPFASGPVYDPASNVLNAEMVGVVPKAILARTGRVRGDHPRSSFAAVGPGARDLIAPQTPLDVFAPLRELVRLGGAVVLMGVGLDRMTLLHTAEQAAGREPFHRWANGPAGTAIEVREGGCSSGFGALGAALDPLARRRTVGGSPWTCYDAGAALAAATEAIRLRPELTRCGDPLCRDCPDAVAGGPIAR